MAFGTDLLFDPEANGMEAALLARFSKYLSNLDLLRMATSKNAELFELSGERIPMRPDRWATTVAKPEWR